MADATGTDGPPWEEGAIHPGYEDEPRFEDESRTIRAANIGDPDADSLLLGALLLIGNQTGGSDSATAALEVVEAPDFARESYQAIYRAILTLHQQQLPYDSVSVDAELRRVGAYKKLDPGLLHELVTLTPAVSLLPTYATHVKRQSVQRRIQAVLHDASRENETGGLSPATAERIRRLAEIAEEGLGAATPPRLQFLLGKDFLEQELARIEPLIGGDDDALMMPGSLGILAGVGGSGKTTLMLHAIAHWAAGLPWFGIPCPRAIRIVVIENEGPHDPFVKKVREFGNRFQNCPCCQPSHGDLGKALLDNCLFLDAPWGHFTFEDKKLAAELRAAVLDFGGDMVVANPLGRLGMRGAGTPEETRAFLDLMFKAGLGEDFAAFLIHHMSKLGRHVPLVQQLSGDWGPHPDTIFVLEPQGERVAKLTFGKVRWGDQGRDPLMLEWLTDPNGPVGYRAESAPQGVTEDEMYERVDKFLAAQTEPLSITEIRRRVTGNNRRLGEILKQGLIDGRYLETGGARNKVWLAGGDIQPDLELEQSRLNWSDDDHPGAYGDLD